MCHLVLVGRQLTGAAVRAVARLTGAAVARRPLAVRKPVVDHLQVAVSPIPVASPVLAARSRTAVVASDYVWPTPIAVVHSLLVLGRLASKGRLILMNAKAAPQNPSDAGSGEAAKKSPTFVVRLLPGLGAAGGVLTVGWVEPLFLGLILAAAWVGVAAISVWFLDRRGR